MRNAGCIALLCILLASCSASRKFVQPALTDSVVAQIDLVDVRNDKVTVTVLPPLITEQTLTFKFPKIIPGTYSISDYGRFIDDLTAYDKKGKKMGLNRTDSNTWVIDNAGQLGRITYKVNDTYDHETSTNVFSEESHDIFSPAGTNILAGKNFVLNLCGFIGYFTGKQENPYSIRISHPQDLFGATALKDEDPAADVDLFVVDRYFDVVDNPIMYSQPDLAKFSVENMDVLLSVYSPRNKNVKANVLAPDLEKMVKAQKNFLGGLSTTPKYAVLAYLTALAKDDAQGIGALEHNASTSSTFRDNMNSEDLVHVISHEFFHTVMPLKIHSKEIQYFNFDEPNMSQHLWFYEGFTEYLAQYFQANQGLTSDEVFLDKMAGMVQNSRTSYNDSLSFTYMSKHILEPKMKAQYPNVYQKGALIGMCIDLLLRKNSNGQKGLKDLLKQLSELYGPDKPFDDNEFIGVITRLTYPEVGNFLEEHVVKGGPIDYKYYLSLVGVEPATIKVPDPIVFIHDKKSYIMLDTTKKQVTALVPDDQNNFVNELGLKPGDVLLSMNDQKFDATNMMATLIMGYGLKEGSPVTIEILRDSKPMKLSGNIKISYTDGPGFRFKDESKKALYDAWLKG